MWVYRPGRSSVKYGEIVENNRIYLFWEGFSEDFSLYKNPSDFKSVIEREKEKPARTTISNLSCQLDYFCNRMKVGEYVLIPEEHSRFYTIALIEGGYQYKADASEFYHSRKIKIIQKDIPRELFPQSIQYSLGAFRTIFHARKSDDILEIINKEYGLNLKEDD